MDSARDLESFLREISQRAFRIARISLREDQDALDAVQEAMIRVARRYADRPREEWSPLFYATLRNCVHDQQRRYKRQTSLLAWLQRWSDPGDAERQGGDTRDESPGPAQHAESAERLRRLELAINRLPPRQQQAFLLRNLEGLDVSDTARAMGCSEGSVKTHYSRAVHTLREKLGDL